ncbi:hypothetical protein [Shimia sp.]|uniref:hypothetical protein n=1 Tax=Shimia sp. TaxID=1954381 RepID=UPI003298FA4D
MPRKISIGRFGLELVINLYGSQSSLWAVCCVLQSPLSALYGHSHLMKHSALWAPTSHWLMGRRIAAKDAKALFCGIPEILVAETKQPFVAARPLLALGSTELSLYII